MFSLFLASIASISLLVGGVGVMNVMLTTVAERTREIGVRKAIGASQKDILTQFIVESCVICIVGGCIGIGLGIAVSKVLPALSGGKLPSSIVESSIALSSVFSLATGLIFGIFPAIRASKLSPAEALRAD
jgi:putative ABC transport system permease protein